MTPEQLNEILKDLQRRTRCGEVLYTGEDPNGNAGCSYKLAVNYVTGDLFYKDEFGDWQPVPSSGGGGGGTAGYIPQGETTFTVGGIPAGTDLGTTEVPVQDILDMMLYAHALPEISLTTPAAPLVREKGNTLASILLNAFTIKHSDPITAVTFYRAASLIHTQASPLVNGGSESYNYTTPITSDTTFSAKVSDGSATVTSNTLVVNFVYPYYYGVGAPGLTNVQIAALTKLVQVQQNITTTTSPSTQVYYFAYPAAYPVLTSILDTNGFETIGDYTIRLVTITGLDGSPQSYRVYEFNNLTTQTGFNNTYKF